MPVVVMGEGGGTHSLKNITYIGFVRVRLRHHGTTSPKEMQLEDARVPCGAREHNKMRKAAHDSSAIMPEYQFMCNVLSIPFD